MTTVPKTKLPKRGKPAKSLTDVLGQSKLAKGMVEEAAAELSSVNTVLKQELEDGARLSGVENVLEKNEAVESKVQEAVEKLTVVNQALADEVKERHALELQLAALTEQEEAARHASLHDPLTGLPNRALFDDRLEHGLAQARRHGWTMAVMFLDLDDFKKINDSYGHDVGDAVLQTIATRLQENLRGEDTVCRHGGDEFLYLLMEIGSEQDATQIVKKIMQAIQAPCELSVGKLTINPSIGIAIFPKDGTSAEALVKSADTAMYQAKQTKSGYSFAQ